MDVETINPADYPTVFVKSPDEKCAVTTADAAVPLASSSSSSSSARRPLVPDNSISRRYGRWINRLRRALIWMKQPRGHAFRGVNSSYHWVCPWPGVAPYLVSATRFVLSALPSVTPVFPSMLQRRVRYYQSRKLIRVVLTHFHRLYYSRLIQLLGVVRAMVESNEAQVTSVLQVSSCTLCIDIDWQQ